MWVSPEYRSSKVAMDLLDAVFGPERMASER